VTEITQHSDYFYKGRIVTVRKDTVLLDDGKTAKREIVEHAPAVVILPLQRPDTLFLVEQYRKPAESVLLELPAGIMDTGEHPLEAAKRELKEETGLEASEWIPLGEAYPSPGFCTEYMYFFLATDLKKGEHSLDEDERITCRSFSLAEFEDFIDKGAIKDAKTLVGYFLFQRKYDRL